MATTAPSTPLAPLAGSTAWSAGAGGGSGVGTGCMRAQRWQAVKATRMSASRPMDSPRNSAAAAGDRVLEQRSGEAGWQLVSEIPVRRALPDALQVAAQLATGQPAPQVYLQFHSPSLPCSHSQAPSLRSEAVCGVELGSARRLRHGEVRLATLPAWCTACYTTTASNCSAISKLKPLRQLHPLTQLAPW